MKQKIVFLFSFLILFIAPLAHADATPSVLSLGVNPSSIRNDYTTTVSWTLTNASGADFYFSCPLGVAIKTSAGSSVACNTRTSLSANTTDSVGLMVTNVSGTTKTIPITLYPKDLSGADYDTAAANTSLTVGTSPQPIITFTDSAPIIASNATLTLTWTGVDTGGTNIIFNCPANVQLFSAGTAIPCGAPAFASDQAVSGSLTITAQNNTVTSTEVSAYLLPAIAPSTYDSTHGLNLTFTVKGKTDPTVSAFTSSATRVSSGNPFTISWATQSAASTNLRFSCLTGLTIESLANDATTTLPCNGTAALGLPATGTTTLVAINSLTAAQTLQAALLPQDANGIAYQNHQQAITITVLGAGAVVAASTTATSTNISSTAATSTGAITHLLFTLPLDRGSQNAQVAALQTFLAQDANIYPEALVTGYFGPATARAVGRFQLRYVLAKTSDPAYGFVGPKTRAKLNSLQTP